MTPFGAGPRAAATRFAPGVQRLAALACALTLAFSCAAAARAPSAAAAGSALSAADAALLAARSAAASGDADRAQELAPQVAGMALEPYVHYWIASARLRAALPDDAPAQAFLTRYPGTVLADRLRAEWMARLAANGDWIGFEAQRHRLVLAGDDPQLVCYGLLSRYQLDDGHRRELIAREARHLLANTSEPAGEGCTALAERLLDEGALSPWLRLQTLVERKQIPAAQAAGARVGPADAGALGHLLVQPRPWLAAVEAHLDTMPHDFPLLAIVTLAHESPEDAAHFAERIDPVLTPEERALVWGMIGRQAELDLLPQADDWCARGGELVGVGAEYVRANDVLETCARAALRHGAVGLPPGADPVGAPARPGPDWAALRALIARMPPDLQAQSTWSYWNAQALLALGRADEGRAGLRALADRFSFYGRLAAEQLDLPLSLAGRPPRPEASLVESLAQRPGFERARKLFELGLRDEGNREWSWELRGLDDASLHAAAELARGIGALDRMIASAERTHALIDIEERYPAPYLDTLGAATGPLGIDPAWVYGLIRQESRFLQDAHSNAGAIGLMQLMPATARYVAHRIGLSGFHSDRIAEVPVNLRLGTEYLKFILDDQDGQLLLAAAAYNAGPARVRRWRAALARPLDGAVFAETIPIGETREYVKHVLFNAVIYDARLDRPHQSLRSLLGPVQPKAVPSTDLP